MEKSFKSAIDAANAILILLPKEPNFDQVAAGLSLYLSLEGKKSVLISSPTQIRVEFNRLVGVDKISDEIGSKNLVLRFLEYPAENIERVSYDIENQQFKLTVIPKPQMEPPKKDQVHATYSGVSADTTVLVGGTNPDSFPALSTEELVATKIVHIGIEDIAAPEGRNIISLARPASSISELMADYIKELNGNFSPDIATNLLSGIHEGSNNFNNKEVSANTFKLSGELMAAGGKYTRKEEFKAPRTFNFPGMPASLGGFASPAGGPNPLTGTPVMGPTPLPVKAQKGAIKQDDQSPEEETSEAPQGEVVNPPSSWLKSPKIYKGTSVS